MLSWKRILDRYGQFRAEAEILLAGFQVLVVNLAYIHRRSPGNSRIVVIVDSWREAMILWLLWIGRALPRYEIWVIRRAADLNPHAERDFHGELLLVATSRAFAKHYQSLADLRRQRRLIVL